MNILVLYSSLTGNTKLLAEVVKKTIEELKYEVEILQISENDMLKNKINKSDVIAIGYWNDRCSANKDVLELSKSIKDKKIILFGTQGALPDSEHGKKCIENVEDIFKDNTILGSFLCQGKINPSITERFRSLPKDNPHYLSDERLARHTEALKHPNEDDFNNMKLFITSTFNEVN